MHHTLYMISVDFLDILISSNLSKFYIIYDVFHREF